MCLVSFLASCGGEGPPEQVKTELPSLSGTATYDETVVSNEVGVKGTQGSPRAASNSTGTSRYKVSLESLTGPYMLRLVGGDKNGQQINLYGLATKAGVANVTPLTTLLTAQLLGQDPAAAYAAFGASGGPRTDLITDANIEDAQAKVVAYLQDTLGIEVSSPTSSFVTTSFSTTAGDPMFSTIKALDDKLAANSTTLAAVSTQIASVSALCLREKITINVNGQVRDFCPSTKSANPDESDPAIFDYVFTDLLDNALTIKVKSDAILSARYVTAAGDTFTCDAAACGGIALGTPNEDLTRNLTFSSADLAGSPAPAVLSGTLLGAIPGVALPILPCDNNKYYMIFDDRSVIGDCVDAFDPLGFGGTLAFISGAAPQRGRYPFANTSTTDPTFPSVEVVTDANTSVLSVYFSRLDPDTFFPTARYVCQGAACNGITLGPLTEDTDVLGPDMPVYIRDITFDNTVLIEIDEQGAATGRSATLKASFRTVYFADPYNVNRFPDPAPCAPGVDVIAMTPDIAEPFSYCSDPLARSTFDNGNDELVLLVSDDFGTQLQLFLESGVVTRVNYNNGNVGQRYVCFTECPRVAVSAPAPDGTRTVKFEATVLHEEQSFPLPGPRTLGLESGEITFPPP